MATPTTHIPRQPVYFDPSSSSTSANNNPTANQQRNADRSENVARQTLGSDPDIAGDAPVKKARSWKWIPGVVVGLVALIGSIVGAILLGLNSMWLGLGICCGLAAVSTIFVIACSMKHHRANNPKPIKPDAGDAV